jgi:hypothetical protein
VDKTMIVNEEDAIKRLNSPMNLINRLKSETGSADRNSKKNNAMSLFGIGRRPPSPENELAVKEVKVNFNPFQAESETKTSLDKTLDTILEDNESKIKLGLAHDKAITLLNNSIDALTANLDNVSASKLPAVISAAAKTIEGIRKERNEAAKIGKDKEVHYHFYTPEQRKVSDYEVIDVA